ncbi:flavin reductase like domain-containing protein [Biscogniauxia marginata]|nr:flavin reductase like domain-containing protein [Biscogniauxia marginata]
MKSPRGLWRAIASPRNASSLSNLKSAGLISSAAVRWKSSGSASRRPQAAAEEPAGPTSQTNAIRSVMRQLPHPVVVITTLDHVLHQPQTPTRMPIPRAMTVSSFTSLTIAPVPHVTFNVTLPSRTHRALEACGVFNAHILEGNDHGARIADRFTRGNSGPPSSPSSSAATAADDDDDGLGILAGLEADLGVRVLGREEWQAEWDQAARKGALTIPPEGTTSADQGSRDVRRTVPVLQGRGILHVLKCRHARLLSPLSFGADQHAIVIGEVLDITTSGCSADTGTGRDELALAYADRAYRRVGERLLGRNSGGDSGGGASR